MRKKEENKSSSRITSDDKKDLLLEEFFEDIEKLTIHDDNDNDTANSDTESNELKAIHNDAKTTTKKEKEHIQEILNRAKARQQSWQEFSIPSSSNAPIDSTDGTETQGRPPISFSLSISKTSVKKKKQANSKRAAKIKPQVATSKPAPAPASLMPPRWIVVLDTCAWIKSFDCVCQILVTAAQQQQHSPSGIATEEEPIVVVIPYILWTELDHQSKQSDEILRYKARRAVRRLNEELVKDDSNSIIRSQSRDEMNQAAVRHSFHRDSINNNDDHILVCAQEEQRLAVSGSNADPQVQQDTRVVLLTLDNVLSGKARANGITVFTPVHFLQHYQQRSSSLKKRKHKR
mmetsp:Transcript_13952/g.21280  ORF Transcript_13952/g.21280 Transcript_13952/m.21280 type:complete len:347 (+) Transcript_13952:163-1203(+)